MGRFELESGTGCGLSGTGRVGFSGASGAAGGGLDLSSLADSELQSLLNNMSQQQLVQLFGGGLSSLAGSGLLSGMYVLFCLYETPPKDSEFP